MIPGIVAGQQLEESAAAVVISAADPLGGLSEVATFAASLSRNLVGSYAGARYVEDTDGIQQISDQTGNGRHLLQSSAIARPNLATAGPNLRACAAFDGVNHRMAMTGISLSNIFGIDTFYVIMSAIIDVIDSNEAVMSSNECLWQDTGWDVGFFMKNTPSGHAMFDDGTEQTTSHSSIPVGTPVVVEVKRDGTTLSSRVNGSAWETAAASLAVSNPTSTVFRIMQNDHFPIFHLLEGDVFEIITYNELLTAAEENALVANMKTHIGA